VDQRGSGESLPPAELKENTTWDLVEDMEKVRKSERMRATVCFPCSRLHPVSLGRRISEQKEGGLTTYRHRPGGPAWIRRIVAARRTEREHDVGPRRGHGKDIRAEGRGTDQLPPKTCHFSIPPMCLRTFSMSSRGVPSVPGFLLSLESSRGAARKADSSFRYPAHTDTVSPLRRWGSAERPRKGLQRLAFWFPYCLTWIHGGPGGGCDGKDAQRFDPEVYRQFQAFFFRSSPPASRSHRCACALFPCPRRGPTSCSLSVRRAATILLIHAGPPGRCLYVLVSPPSFCSDILRPRLTG
jgi:hypothetical protein